ncbi:SRPBCC family protein [Nonomuraea turcica]|uniref:SRPBCC family protein n=1 Tax=Nonomuraea sp. G32 TaxID=3067274 RepID=UPI00273AF83E|nr:SRPBCC family protein [Nonomuraea sp. G32]MDP4502294.1 SRPBCC family protein [Nonomuraea sp. G32]
MRLRHTFTLAEEPARVFDLFLDVERIAGCMPGSRLLGRADDAYEGEVKVKVGPLGVAYRGKVRFLEADEASRRVVLRASGAEQNGNGNADAHVVAELAPDPAGTKVSLDTDLMIRGRVAQFGRGVIADVSRRLIDEFATNLETLLTHPEPAPPADTRGSTQPAPAPSSGSDRATSPSGVRGSADPATASTSEPETPALDGLRLVALPLLRRAAPVLAAFAAGVIAGALATRSRRRRR